MVEVSVPATTANLGPGFDTLGLALSLYNRFRFTPANQDSLVNSAQSTFPLELDTEIPQDNLLFQALNTIYSHQGIERPSFQVEIEAHIPLARGLGSSSSAIVGSLVAGNHLLGNPLSQSQLCQLATKLEGHPDNVAPALYGGMRLCDENNTYPLSWPSNWQIAIVVPEKPLLTHQARQVLPQQYSLQDSIFNLRKTSLLIYSVLTQNRDGFSQALLDRLHQPYRAALIPHFNPIMECCINHGGLGAVISGAGPSVAIFYEETVKTNLIIALDQCLQTQNDQFKIHDLSPDLVGAQVIH